ncbi:MAG: glycoside hydrolase family 18 protein [Acidobacteriota bacterium]
MRLSISLLLFIALSIANAQASPLVIAYVFPQNTPLSPGQIDPRAIDRVNYAFSAIDHDRMVVGSPQDATNFAVLTSLRRQNPHLAILVSVGGWLGSGQFSHMAATSERRALFAQSVVEFLRRYGLDGLDVDWEYPGQPGSGHAYKREDKQNYTELLKELRSRFDEEQRRTGNHLFLSVAAGATEDFLAHTEMNRVAQYVDTVNLMTYDYYEPGSEKITGHHAPLYRNPADPEGVSTDGSVRAFEQAGVPARKIVVGIPFYGHVWKDVPDLQHGLYEPGKAPSNGGAPFSQIQSEMLGHGFVRTWDSAAHAPSLYNPQTHMFVSYDDPQSVTEKCHYVLDNRLAGVMFWYYGADNGVLLHTIDTTFNHK